MTRETRDAPTALMKGLVEQLQGMKDRDGVSLVHVSRDGHTASRAPRDNDPRPPFLRMLLTFFSVIPWRPRENRTEKTRLPAAGPGLLHFHVFHPGQRLGGFFSGHRSPPELEPDGRDHDR